MRKEGSSEYIRQLRRIAAGEISPAAADRLLAIAVSEYVGIGFRCAEPPQEFIEEVVKALRVVEKEDPRAAMAVKLRFGKHTSRVLTFREVGRELGISDRRAREVCARGLEKLAYTLTKQRSWRLLGF
jgi:hypothetical protein